MDSASGYRLRTKGLGDVSSLVDSFRTSALKILGRKYGTLVARRAALAVDAARLGSRAPSTDPVADACREVRRALAGEGGTVKWGSLNCVVTFHFVGEAVLATFSHGDGEYRAAWESLRAVARWGWEDGRERPPRVPERDWEARRTLWSAAAARPGFGSGLSFVLIQRPLPDLGWDGFRRWIPDVNERARLAAEEWASSGKAPPREAREPGKLVAMAAARIEPTLARENFYPKVAAAKPRPGPRPQPARQAAKAARPAKGRDDDRVASIDHADVMVTRDGRTFMAVPYAGLAEGTRVFVQVGDGHVTIAQGGTQFGHVAGVKKSALDVLRACKTVIMVEVSKDADGGRLLRARHVAIVSDIGLRESVAIAFRRPDMAALREEEIAEWDRDR